jgi:hypothetical protein
MCMISEIIRTCSHEEVAKAAVESMGPFFAEKVEATAGAQGLSIGAFTARAVREFERFSREEDWQTLRELMEGSDQPILIGLQHILWPVIENDGTELRLRKPRQAKAGQPPQPRPSSISTRETKKTCDSIC